MISHSTRGLRPKRRRVDKQAHERVDERDPQQRARMCVPGDEDDDDVDEDDDASAKTGTARHCVRQPERILYPGSERLDCDRRGMLRTRLTSRRRTWSVRCQHVGESCKPKRSATMAKGISGSPPTHTYTRAQPFIDAYACARAGLMRRKSRKNRHFRISLREPFGAKQA